MSNQQAIDEIHKASINVENLNNRYVTLVNTLANNISPKLHTSKASINQAYENFKKAYSGDSLETYKKSFTNIYDDLDSIISDLVNKIIPELQTLIQNNNSLIDGYNAQIASLANG